MAPSECVKVVVRCRPLNSKETADGRVQVVEMDERMGMVALSGGSGSSGEPPKTFTFDSVFPPNTEQERIYKATAAPICDSVLEGYNGTIFAYGQTGTGKTFTMEGMNDPPELRGIIPRAFAQVFEQIVSRGGEATEFLVRASYLEIYNEDVRDLLSKSATNKLELKETPESGVYVKDLTSYVVKTVRFASAHPATLCRGACNHMSLSPQPYVVEPAALCRGACNPMPPGARVRQAAGLWRQEPSHGRYRHEPGFLPLALDLYDHHGEL